MDRGIEANNRFKNNENGFIYNQKRINIFRAARDRHLDFLIRIQKKKSSNTVGIGESSFYKYGSITFATASRLLTAAVGKQLLTAKQQQADCTIT